MALQPGVAEIRLNRGIIYEKMSRLDKAIEDFNEAIRLSPNYPEAYVDRARAYKTKGLVAEAEADLAKARELRKAPRP